MIEKKSVASVSIIIPVYNEKNTILDVLAKVKEAEVGKLKKEVIIIDDGSTDGTREILKDVNNAKVFFHEFNKGKGAAIRTGLQHARGEVVLIQDADLEYNPEEYKKLLEPIITSKADVVYGSRFANGKIFNKNMYYSHCIGNMVLTNVTNLLYGANLEDMETCYKVIRKEILNNIDLKSDRFEIEPELTAKILKKGINIHEVPISFAPRGFYEGKKINWRDGIIALWTLVKYRVKE